jgi:hypothetical protein
VNRPKAARLVEMFADDGGLLARAPQGGADRSASGAVPHLPRHRVLAADLVAGLLSTDKRSGSA